ncbi:hypothetical protein GCM10020369_66320 [Cryptosporangium minutisporangium]|uniref:BON domain-containing protein n=1 Tax=Cryptosporangium minutisporangium TaxID=113569 RepID=A0ABP6T909_9ACTN
MPPGGQDHHRCGGYGSGDDDPQPRGAPWTGWELLNEDERADRQHEPAEDPPREVFPDPAGPPAPGEAPCVVTLRGHVERRTQAELAVALARQVDGVSEVVDALRSRVDDRA